MKRPIDMLVLLGPNGAGKTTVGQILERYFPCTFLGLEGFFVQSYGSLANYGQYRQQAYQAFEKLVRWTRATTGRTVVFEEIGLGDEARSMISSLQRDYRVCLVKILADKETCVRRVAVRSTVEDVPKTLEGVARVRSLFIEEIDSHYACELEVHNDQGLSAEEICAQFGHLFA